MDPTLGRPATTPRLRPLEGDPWPCDPSVPLRATAPALAHFGWPASPARDAGWRQVRRVVPTDGPPPGYRDGMR